MPARARVPHGEVVGDGAGPGHRPRAWSGSSGSGRRALLRTEGPRRGSICPAGSTGPAVAENQRCPLTRQADASPSTCGNGRSTRATVRTSRFRDAPGAFPRSR